MAPRSTLSTPSLAGASPSRTRTPPQPAVADPRSASTKEPLEFSGLRPAGGKRSSQCDRILNLFLRQKGHLSADDLCDLVHEEDPRIGRAVSYTHLTLPTSDLV